MSETEQEGGTALREASAADAAAVIELWREAGLTRPWNDPALDFERALAAADATIIVIIADGPPLGSVMAGYDGHRGWIYYLAVARRVRGQGHGRALMRAAEAWLRARGAPKVQVMVREDNDAALGFYRALGLERQKVVTFGRFLAD